MILLQESESIADESTTTLDGNNMGKVIIISLSYGSCADCHHNHHTVIVGSSFLIKPVNFPYL